jgi:hypothetical protein
VRSGGAWVVEWVPSNVFNMNPSLLVHSSGVPLLGFTMNGGFSPNGVLTYGHRQGGAWTLEAIDHVGWPGAGSAVGCALAFANGRPLIAYHDYTVSGLMLAVGSRVSDVPESAERARSSLALAWPNPWRCGETINLQLALGGGARHTLELVDVGGRRIARKDLEGLPAGPHLVRWAPAVRASGVYFIRLLEGTRTIGSIRAVAVE